MKKTIVYAFMNAYSSGKSGGDIRFIEVAKRWKNADITVVTSQKGADLCQESKLSVKTKITSNEKVFSGIFSTYLKRTIRALVATYKRNGQVLWYATSDFFPDVIPAFFLKRNGEKWVQLIHHLYPHYSTRPGNIALNTIAYYLQKISFWLIKRRADVIIVANELVKTQLLHHGFDLAKLFVSSNGINFSSLQKISPAIDQYGGIFMGRLTYSKGVFDLVDIWKLIVKKNPTARLAIVGEGNKELKNQLIRSIRKNRLENNIELLGYLSDERAIGLIKSSVIFIFPSYEEGFGIAIVEALACGRTVVTYGLPTLRSVFKNAIETVPCYNKQIFARKVLALLQKKPSAQTSANRIEFARQFDWDRIIADELRYIDRTLKVGLQS